MLHLMKSEGLEVQVFENRTQMGIQAAKELSDCILSLLHSQQEINIIFAAAPSQNDFLSALLKHDLPWSKINAFHMDEYIGLTADAPQGFGNFLKARIFDRLPFKSVAYMDSTAVDTSSEVQRYANLLERYPVDIVCMGIGENGHIAFNDPPVADFDDPLLVKKVELDLVCRQQQVNDGCFSSLQEVPMEALTLTIPTLLKAKFIFCIVPGKTKALAVSSTLYNAIGVQCPATILRKHQHAKLYLDQDSSSLLDI